MVSSTNTLNFQSMYDEKYIFFPRKLEGLSTSCMPEHDKYGVSLEPSFLICKIGTLLYRVM